MRTFSPAPTSDRPSARSKSSSPRSHDVAYDGIEALDAAAEFRPEVVLLDIGMPKLSGYDVARRIREARGTSVLIVAITGWGQEQDRQRARDAGFNYHFTKPVNFEMLLDLIDREAPRTASRAS